MSIFAAEPPVIGAEPVRTAKPAVVLSAIFIIIEIVLAAETIAVILLKEIGPKNPGSAPIAVLLSIALLANLGVVSSVAAADAASSVREWKRDRDHKLSGWFAPAGPGMPASG